MKILHTSDWHLGRSLFGRKRYQEFDLFLHWLSKELEQLAVDVLIVAGDIFDTNAPSNRAQAMYYQFLQRVALSRCRHVIVVAGNHDSPSFLTAPQALLKTLNVHVVGSVTENIDDQVIVLRDGVGEVELIVCAVPYLRDRDIRQVELGESIEDKEHKLLQGIRQHYQKIAECAEQKRQSLGAHVPIIATGHLFAAGGQTVDGDGVRELYVGSLAHVSANIFPSLFNYVALGHLHVPQKVGGHTHIRYCGSPLAMGFGEAKQQKQVCIVQFLAGDNNSDASATSSSDVCQSIDAKAICPPSCTVSTVAVPVFQKLVRIAGDWPSITARISECIQDCEENNTAGEDVLSSGREAVSCWLEVIYQGDELLPDLKARLDQCIAGSKLEILRVKNNRVIDGVLSALDSGENLDDLNVNEVFMRCLDANTVVETQRQDLLLAYQQVLASFNDSNSDEHQDINKHKDNSCSTPKAGDCK